MKILVITNFYPPEFLGGYELGCYQAVTALQAAGHEVLVLTAMPRHGRQPAADGVLRRLHLADVYEPYTQSRLSAQSKALLCKDAFALQPDNIHTLVEVAEDFRPDVAYVWNIVGMGSLGLLAALQHSGIPWVMHLMDRVPWTFCANSLTAVTPAVPGLARAFTRYCRGRFICCSQVTLTEIESGGVPIADRTTIIPNWVVTESAPKRKYYRPGETLKIAFAGQIGTHKGADILIRAAKLLQDRGTGDFEIDMYGPGDDPRFAQMILTLGLGDRVRLRGVCGQDELIARYAEYDVFAFPTWAREPFGFAPMEALAKGCVPLVSRQCGFSEWFVHGVDCLKAERNEESFAEMLGAILQGEIKIEELGRRGAGIVNRDFHIDALLPRIERELELAVERGGGPAHPAAETYKMAILLQKTLTGLLCEVTP